MNEAEIEWEPLSRDWQFPIQTSARLGKYYDSFEIRRDEGQELVVSAKGSLPDQPESQLLDSEPGLAGEPLTPEANLEVMMKSADWKITLRSPHMERRPGFSGRSLIRSIHVNTVRFERQPMTSGAHCCSVWCLNGPTALGDPTFGRVTHRRGGSTYQRDRKGEFPSAGTAIADGWGMSWDWISVPGVLDDGPAIFARGAESITPAKFNPYVLEFDLPANHLPNWETVDHHLGAMSFVFGRRLIPVGFTVFDDQWKPLVHELRSAWSHDLRQECSQRSYPPISSGVGELIDEDMFAALTTKFRSAQLKYRLDDAIWRLLYAESTLLEVAIPHCAASLEGLMNAWFKSGASRSRRRYMDDENWSKLSSEPLELLKRSLDGHKFAERILGRAKNANFFQVNEAFPQFLSELELTIGAVEDRAFHARNKVAHGGTVTASEQLFLLSNLRAYQTLVHRVVLKMIGWDGDYIDYSRSCPA